MDQYKKKQVNLLPDLYFKKKRRVKFVVLVAFIVVLAISGFVLHLVDLYKELEEVKTENILTIQAIQEKEEERQRQTLLTVLKTRIEFKVNLLKEIEAENASVIQVSEAIESVLPKGALYVNVDFDSTESMNVFGRTKTESEIPDLIHKLRELNLFKNIEIESVTKSEFEYYSGEEIYYDFVLICKFGGEDNETD